MFKKLTLQDITYSSIFAAIIVVLSYISIPIPFSTVPLTGQTLGIMLAGSVLKLRQAALSVLIFILLGAIGLPVFAGGTSGINVILGPTGGYIFGFLVGVLAIGVLKGDGTKKSRVAAANAFGGIIVVYVFGVLWLSYSTGMGLKSALAAGAVPFLMGDFVKVVIATPLAVSLKKQLRVVTAQ